MEPFKLGLSCLGILLCLQAEVVNASENITALPGSSRVDFNNSTSMKELNSVIRMRKSKKVIAEEYGRNWKSAMLVLSPLAFILGLLILILNIHYNKKKKMLSALTSYPQPGHGAAWAHERSPLTAAAVTQQHYSGQASPARSLRHGEILIEWKDGTVTPLFDNFTYQILKEK